MRFWKKLGPSTAGAMAGSAVTLLLLQGSAEVARTGAPPVRLAAGETLDLGARESVPRAIESDAPLLASAKGSARAALAIEDREDPATMDREALVAELGRLRRDRDEIREEKTRLASRLASLENGDRPRETYSRIPREELQESAEKGRVRIRLPHVFSGSDKLWHEQAASDLRLTADEEAALRRVYSDSARRIHDQLVRLYAEIGGDATAAMEMSAHSLFSEIQAKSLPGDLDRAIWTAANERSGRVEAGTNGSALVRTFRMLWQEDDRVVSEVEQILGSHRASEFLNHEAWQHSDWVFGAGRK